MPAIQVHEVGSEVLENFCGDLTLRRDIDLRATLLWNAHGPDGLTYTMDNLHGTIKVTNLDNGKTITEVFNRPAKDLEVLDNGDGTLTLRGFLTGVWQTYGPDGELLFVDAGRSMAEMVFDNGGTPTDPSDDQFLSWRVLSGRTGRNDSVGTDYCDLLHEYIG